MSYLQVFINAIVIALVAMYVYENERKMGEMSTRHSETEKELDALKIVAKSKQDQIKELKQVLSTKAETEKLTLIENQQIAGTRKLTEIENQQIAGTRNLTEVANQQIAGTRNLTEVANQQIAGTIKLNEMENQLNAGTRKQAELENQQNTESKKLAEVENQQLKSNEKVLALERKLVDEITDTKQLLSTKAGIKKLAEIENQQLESEKKGVTYIRWGKTKCDGSNTETIYSGQVGGGHFTHTGASVNYICLPNNPDVAQPLKLHDHYAYLYGAEYEIFDYNKPHGIKSGIGQHDVACAACLAKGKISSILIPGRKTCYNGWTKEYEGILMAGYHSHAAASEYACVDRDTEAIAGGSNNDNEKLFFPVKTSCGSLKCPPYKEGTEVLCVVCSK